MTEALQVLLDQNFPQPPVGMMWQQLDKSVVFSHFSTAFPEYAKVRTPDWMVYLLAKRRGLDVVVTSDHSQLSQDVELISLEITRLGLITWKGRQEDTVVMYGQLLAFMPRIVAEFRTHPDAVVMLPTPTLRPKEHFSRARDHARGRKMYDGLSHPERRSKSLTVMRDHLRDLSEDTLLDLVPDR